ncbi:MAG: hypothetical protein U0P45_07905, partial [Acidimicrobiales bacterium]
MGTAGSIEGFWAWWDEARHRVDAAIADHTLPAMAEEISGAVHAIDPELEWELGPGTQARHVLTVTCAGKPAQRATAERWRLAGPPADATWEYASTRPRHVGPEAPVLRLGPHELPLDQVRFGADLDPDRRLIDVVVHHPAFADLDEDACHTVSFLSLDWALGEDGVERWVGQILPSPDEPTSPVDVDGLRQAIDALAAEHREDTWSLLQGTTPGGDQILVRALRPLKPIDHPLLDALVRIDVPLPDGLDGGGDLLDRLHDLEEALVARFEGRALLVAVVTTQRSRTVHLYADAESPTPGEIQRFESPWVRWRLLTLET